MLWSFDSYSSTSRIELQYRASTVSVDQPENVVQTPRKKTVFEPDMLLRAFHVVRQLLFLRCCMRDTRITVTGICGEHRHG